MAIATVPASALTVTFDFESGPNGPVLFFSESGVDLTVTAQGPGGPTNVSQGDNGLGVAGGPEAGRLADGETLFLDFSAPVRILSFVFFEGGNQDEFVGINGGAPLTIPGPGGNQNTIDVAAAGLTGFGFAIDGLSPAGPGNRGVRLLGLTAEVIPLPASAVLLLAGLGALALPRYRRARAA